MASSSSALPKTPPADFDVDLQERLLNAVRGTGGPKITDSHLRVVDKEFPIAGTKTTVHCYSPALDAHGRMKIKPLAEFLTDRIIEYAIPRTAVEKAQKEAEEHNSYAAVLKLQRKAKAAFTEIKNSGEGGEFLVFALAEAVFEFTQILCKMSLKTSSSMHYHGADGVYANADSDGYLNVFWGESKLYENPTNAITDCLKSLAPFLNEEFGTDAANSRDIFLINDYADLTDQEALRALKSYFDFDHPNSNKLKLCGFALVGFDNSAFPSEGNTAVWDDVEKELVSNLPNWRTHVEKRIGEESIEGFDIHFVCIPMRSVEEFRNVFLHMIGH